MKNKKNYVYSYPEIETAKLFLTDQTDLLNEEVHHNFFHLPLPSDENEVTVDDMMMLLDRIKLNRRKQLMASPLKIDLIYYLWFDDQAGQLRFNFINSNHSKLPFGCSLHVVDSERQIVETFMTSPYSGGIPLNDVNEADGNDRADEDEDIPFVLDIFVEKIRRDDK